MIRDGDRLTTVSTNRIPRLRVLRGETILNPDGSVAWLQQLELLEPQGEGGVLRVLWETTGASAAFRVRH